MLIPYQVDVPMQRWPIANWVLIGVTCILSIALFPALSDWGAGRSRVMHTHIDHNTGDIIYEPTGSDATTIDYFLLQPNNFHAPQLLGAAFIHIGIGHLVGNMIFLWVFGNAINAKLGHIRYILFYLLAAIVVNLVYLILGPSMPCLGASGAIMAVVGAFLVVYPLNEISCFTFLIYRPVTFSLSSYWIILLYIAFDIWGLASSSSGGVAYISHVTGFLFGAAAMAAAIRWNQVEPDSNERNLLEICNLVPQSQRQRNAASEYSPKRKPIVTSARR